MAEAFAVVGIVASIAQLVDICAKVCGRLEKFHSDLDERKAQVLASPSAATMLGHALEL